MDNYHEGFKDGYSKGFTDFLKEIFSGNLDGACEEAFLEIFNREFENLPINFNDEYYEILKRIYKSFFSAIYKDAFADGFFHCKSEGELPFEAYVDKLESLEEDNELNEDYECEECNEDDEDCIYNEDEDDNYYDEDVEKTVEEMTQEYYDDWVELDYAIEHGVYDDEA